MTKLNVVIPIINNEEGTLETLRSFIGKADKPYEINWIIVDNGSDPPATDWLKGFLDEDAALKIIVIRNDENVGVSKALNQGWSVSKEGDYYADYIFYSHNDVIINQKGWDTELYHWLAVIEQNENVKTGVIGFGGAPTLGSHDIYKTEYNIWQLARFGFFSNMQEAEVHGRRMTERIEPCAVLDGFSLIVNRELLELVGGFDAVNYPIHHMYDNDICLEALKNGFVNFVLAIDVHHKGGMTAVHSDYAEWAKPYGGDTQIHADAHVNFYEKWRAFLPVTVHQGTPPKNEE